MTNLPKTMSGVLLTRHGGPEALERRDDIPVPTPGPGQVLVQVLAAGVNNTDINTRIGWYARLVTSATEAVTSDTQVEAGGWDGALAFPRIQGGDLCGRVVALGQGVTEVSLGARVTCPINMPRPTPDNPVGIFVLGSETNGAFAQFCCVEAADLYDVTASPLTDTEIAAIPCAYGTALAMLAKAGVNKGHKVLVTGASGGVGMAAVQLAKLMQAQVTAVTSATKAKAVRAAGADQTLDRNDPLPEAQFDVVIDVVGGPSFPALVAALKTGGHLAFAGAIAGPMVQLDLRDLYLRDITLHGSTYQSPEVFQRLVDLINQGQIRPLVSKTYPLKNIAEAQADFTAKRFPGKLVLYPPEIPK